MRFLWITVVALIPVAACTSDSSSVSHATISGSGANLMHHGFDAGAAMGDWSGPRQAGVLTAASVADGLDQAIALTIKGPVPVAGARISFDADRTTGSLTYGDSSGQAERRVWASTAGTVTVDAVSPSETDPSMVVEISFAHVTAAPDPSASQNTATGTITLDGALRIEGVYLP